MVNDPAAAASLNVVSRKLPRHQSAALVVPPGTISRAIFGYIQSVAGHGWPSSAAAQRRAAGRTMGNWHHLLVESDQGGRESGQQEKDLFHALYTVFDVDQVEGHHLDHLRVGHSVSNTNPVDTYEEADRVIEATQAHIRFGGNQAFSSPSGDFIQVPLREQFSAGEWYETIFHELCHRARLKWNPAEGYALGDSWPK